MRSNLRAIVANRIGTVEMGPDAHHPAVLLQFADIFAEAKKMPLSLVVAA